MWLMGRGGFGLVSSGKYGCPGGCLDLLVVQG